MASLITKLYKQGDFYLEHDAKPEYADLVTEYRRENAGPEEILGIGKSEGKFIVLMKGALLSSATLGIGCLDDLITVDAKNHLAFLVVTFDLAKLDEAMREAELKHNALYAQATNRVDSTGMTEEEMDDPETVRVRVAHIGKQDNAALYITKRLRPAADGTLLNQYVFRLDSLAEDDSAEEPCLCIVK